MRYTGPKNKRARREATDLGMKTPGSGSHASLLKKLNIPPGQHGVGKGRRRKKFSERGKQLREKQKLRYLFGLNETQLKNYFKKAIKIKGNTAENLSNLLEKRLDNMVYRLGLAPTRASARQLITHRHIVVNDKAVNIPSYKVSIGEKLNFLDKKSAKIPYIESSLSNKDFMVPKWIDKKGEAGGLVEEPTSEEIEKQINLRSVIEYYSR